MTDYEIRSYLPNHRKLVLRSLNGAEDTDIEDQVINLQQNLLTHMVALLYTTEYMESEQCAVWWARVIIMGIQMGKL